MKQRETAEQIAVLIERLGRLGRMLQHRGGLNPVQWEAVRYIAQANRYSRNPAAVAEFLGSTRGTVSQTLIALVRKGLIRRQRSTTDGRRANLELTAAGRAATLSDPLSLLAGAATHLEFTHQQALAAGLTALLLELQRRNGFRSFGMCATCRHFRRDDASDERGGPHRCGLTHEPLSDSESSLICREHAQEAA